MKRRPLPRLKRSRTSTFRQAVTDFLQTSRIDSFKNDKHRAQWRSTLETYAFPILGDLPLQSIDSAVVLQALLPVWKRVPETASRLRGRIERVFEWARPLGLFAGPNPASRETLKDHLPAKAAPRHHPALPYSEMASFMADLRKRDCTSAAALEFLVLTAARTAEVTGAKWSEIDLDAATWSIDASRMKAKNPHRVPLSDRALVILKALPRTGDHLFLNGGNLPLSNQAMSELLKSMVPPEKATVHGFRSSFSDWARDCTAYPRDLVEQCLAHVIKDKSERAYRRGDALDKRRRLMAEWSKFCEAPMVTGATIHKIGKAVGSPLEWNGET